MKRYFRIYLFLIIIIVLAFTLSAAQQLDTHARVSLNFDDTPITSVLQMLAQQNQLNLVVSSKVEGNISLNLYDVGLQAALNAILLPNGYNYHIGNGIIMVKTNEQKVTGELVARPYRLKYITAAIAQTAVELLLSDNGKIVSLAANGDTGLSEQTDISGGTQLLVYDYPENLALIESLIKQIDYQPRQVSVEVKIIETNLTKDEKLGINWPNLISTSIEGVASPISSTILDNSTTSSEAAIKSLDNGHWQLGYLTVHQVDIILDFLEKRDNSKLLSNPRLTTTENMPAEIKIQTVIPIPTINRFSEGAIIQDIITFQDIEVGISLRVTPRINDDSTITLHVNPVVEEIIGYTGGTGTQKPITSERSIDTYVTVGNNQTIALGGLLKETTFETEEKIFLLGHIPILGHLFTSRSTETKTTDLLILITPRIID